MKTNNKLGASARFSSIKSLVMIAVALGASLIATAPAKADAVADAVTAMSGYVTSVEAAGTVVVGVAGVFALFKLAKRVLAKV